MICITIKLYVCYHDGCHNRSPLSHARFAPKSTEHVDHGSCRRRSTDYFNMLSRVLFGFEYLALGTFRFPSDDYVKNSGLTSYLLSIVNFQPKDNVETFIGVA